MTENASLADCASFVSGGTPSKAREEFWDGDIPWLSAKDMKTFYIRDCEDHISKEAVTAGARCVGQDATLVLVRGMTLLKDVPIVVPSQRLAFNQDVKAVIPKAGIHDRFLTYALVARRPELLTFVELAGHGTGRLPTDRLASLSIWRPPLPEQRAIAGVLGALDDKIELNRRMNETLEEIARALFKSWFVDFDPVRAKSKGRQPWGMDAATSALFPSEFEDSELGQIPKGWRVRSIGDIASLDKGVSYKGEFLTHDGIPMVNLGCFGGNGRFMPEKLKPYAGDHRDRHLVSPGDIVIANTDMTQHRVILGSPAIVPDLQGHDRLLFSHHVFALRLNERWGESREFMYQQFLRPEFRERAEGYATGTTVLALPRDAVLMLPFIEPDHAVLHAFAEVANPLRKRAEVSAKESKTLAELRDTLLPKLMSGEVRVRDAERAVEAVG